jgi:MFS family permease
MLIGLFCGGAVVVLDFFIVLVALPSIGHSLGATPSQLQLVMAAYAITNGSLLVVGGRLGDVWGRRRTFMLGLVGFALASVACGLAGSAVVLIVCRALQGLFGALLQPQVLGLISVNITPDWRERVFARYAAVMGAAGIAAQLLGGLLVGTLPPDVGWRMGFYLAVPVCALAAWLARDAGGGRRDAAGRLDVPGALMLGLALAGIGTVLTIGRESAWPAWTGQLAAASLVLLVVFVAWVVQGNRRGHPRLIPSGLWQVPGFPRSLASILVFFSGVASLYFVLALALRSAAGFSPMQVGLLFAWLGVCFVAGSSAKRWPIRWLAPRPLHGVLLLGAGHGLMVLAASNLAPTWTVPLFVCSSALQGLGIGRLMGTLMARALALVRPDQASVGGGLAASTQQIGNSMGICLIGLAYWGPSEGASGTAQGDMPGAALYLTASLALLAWAMRERRQAAAAPA